MEDNLRIELKSCEAGEEDRNRGRRHLDIGKFIAIASQQEIDQVACKDCD